jgi:ATP-dependent Clp protease ATP-binding subunit ClpA
MFERYSILARQAAMVARIEAGQVGADQMDSEHLLIGVLSVHPELPELLKTSIELSQLRGQRDRWHTPSSPIPNSQDLPITPDLNRVFARVASIADGLQCPEIRTEHLLLSMVGEPCHASQMLADCGISEESVQALVANVNCEAPQSGTAAALEAMKALFSGP